MEIMVEILRWVLILVVGLTVVALFIGSLGAATLTLLLKKGDAIPVSIVEAASKVEGDGFRPYLFKVSVVSCLFVLAWSSIGLGLTMYCVLQGSRYGFYLSMSTLARAARS